LPGGSRFIESGASARYLRRVRPIYRDRRDATITALATLLPSADWRGEAAGLHLYVTLPEYTDEGVLARAAYDRHVLIETGAWHWAEPERAPRSLVLGYGAATEQEIRRGLQIVADAVRESSRPRTRTARAPA
jgi:GntR family transcriptional regulator/MocR family aminotransferase